MNMRKLTCGLLAPAAWLGLTVAVAQAQILPVNPTTLVPISGSPVTVSLFQNGANVTSSWLPEPDQPVQIVVSGLASPSISLVCPDGAMTVPPAAACPVVRSIPPDTNPFLNKATGFAGTSAYPGVCTNSGSPTDLSPDYELSVNTLTPKDCGGLAVIRVTTATDNLLFLLPAQGSDPNGIPQIWKDIFCPANSCPTGKEDLDAGPLADSPIGDGISAFDEYRGFMVSGVHVRLDPRQRDVFVHMQNPGCTTDLAAAELLSGGFDKTYPTPTSPAATLTLAAASGLGVVATASAAVFSAAHARSEILAGTGRATIASIMSPTSVVVDITNNFDALSKPSGSWQLRESLFANLYTLLAPERVHLLGYTLLAGNPKTAEWVDKFDSLVPPQTFNSTDSVSDRIVNPNRLYGAPQKGVRLLGCQDTSNADRLGWSYGTGSPNSVGDLGNIIVYTQRIVNNVAGFLAAGGTVKYSTFVNGAWSTPTLVLNGSSANPDVADFLISKVIQYVVAMEIGHVLFLTPTVMGTHKTSFGTHYCPGCGDALDQTFTNKNKSGVNTFSIPSIYGGADRKDFLIK